MEQATKNTSDSEGWSRDSNSFCLTSRSTVTNRRNDLTSKAYQSGGDSDSTLIRRPQYAVYRNEVEVPIHRISISGRNWVEPRNSGYSGETLIMNRDSRRQQRILRQDKETRVITKMTIPPLESPNLGLPRNQRSYSTDANREVRPTSQHRQQKINTPDPAGRSQSAGRRKKSHHHSHCCYHKHPRSHSRARDIYGTVRGMPMAISYPTPPLTFYPDWTSNYAPVSPAAYYYQEDYAAPVSGVPYLASPAIPIHYSLPRRFPPATAAYGPRPSIQMSAVPSMTPGTAQRFPPIYPRSARLSTQYHCVCCPNGAHQGTAERNSRVFNFESDQWEADGMASLNPNQYGRSSRTKSSRSKQQYMETQRMQSQSMSMESGSKLRQLPTEFEMPMQKETPTAAPYEIASPENAFTLQNYKRTWDSITSPKDVLSAPLAHGEIARNDEFPQDYVDLTDVGIEYTNGMESGDDCDSLPPPDKRVVLKLAKSAISTGTSQTNVAACLKKSMDKEFGPVWHVIAGTGAYGSNIASLGGQLLHFKAFGWAFLIWKTSDQ